MTKFGKIVLTLVVIAIGAFAVMNWWPRLSGGDSPEVSTSPSAQTGSEVPAAPDRSADADELEGEFAFVDPPDQAPRLPPAQPYRMDGDVVLIELSEYAGYAGLMVANGGLEPNPNSFFAKEYGFQVKIELSEEDSWPALQSGKMAASATTVDVLAVYGRQFEVVAPVQIAFSRGADGIIVRSDIRRINDLKGKVIAAAPFNETEFFIRYLAQEADLGVKRLPGLAAKPDPEKVNLVFCEDAFVAGDAFLADLQSDGPGLLAGCVTWAPKTTEIVEESGGKAKQLVDNRNLLIVADILMFNRGFAQEHPDKVKGIVHGLLHGNALIRENPSAYYQKVADAFSEYEWSADDAQDELAKVHLSNLPENLAFFSGAIDAFGSFESIYQSAALAYGSDIVPNPAPADHFMDLAALRALEGTPEFANQEIAVQPVRSSDRSPVENDPLLSRNIRFLFQPNSADLDMSAPENTEYLETIRKMLQVSPGSVILLRGHVDDSMAPEFRAQGGESLVRSMALKAMQLSKDRAEEVRSILLSQFPGIDPSRVEMIGRGWEEPLGADAEQNRRVEVQWFTLE